MNHTFLCNICAEDITDLSKKVILKCNPQHIFCYDCIFDWYFKNKGNNSSASSGNMYKYATCPICQKDGGFLTLPEGKVGIENIHFPKKIVQSYTYKPCICTEQAMNGTYYSCNSSGSHILSLTPDKSVHICYHHMYKYKKGETLTIKNNETYQVVESIYGKKACTVTLKNGSQCSGNANPQKNGNYITIEKDGAKYCVCKKHGEDFLLNKVLMIQNKQIVNEENPINNDLCGALLSSGHLCKKKGNPIYGGKCGIHKPKDTKVDSEDLQEEDYKVSYKKIKEDYESLYQKLNNTFAFLKDNVDKTVLENKVKYLETILGNIKNSIQNIGLNEITSKVDNNMVTIKFNLEENVETLKNGINDFDILVNKVFHKEDENKDVFEELNNKVKETKKELKIDLYNSEFKIDPHCNVKQKNGKLCNNPANVYYNLKCYKHHQDHYLKEKLTSNDESYIVKSSKEKKEIKNDLS
jgi:hypothetical protein